MSIWSEEYRPETLNDCILPKSVETLHNLVSKGEIPNLLFYGVPGIGKTTAAISICKMLKMDYLVINASDDSGIDILRTTVKRYATSMSFDGSKKCIILDEADGTTPKFQEALRGVINDSHSNCVFILTCNNRNKLHKAIWSRCSNFEFIIPKNEIPSIAGKLYKRVMFILDKENVKVECDDVVKQIVKSFFPDIRRVINELQKHSGTGIIDISVLDMISKVNITELVEYLKTKQFNKMVQWVKDNVDDADLLFTEVYKHASNLLTPNSLPELILILNEGQYKNSFVANIEINVVSVLTEIMMNKGISFK